MDFWFVGCFWYWHGYIFLWFCCCCDPIILECNASRCRFPINVSQNCDVTNAMLRVLLYLLFLGLVSSLVASFCRHKLALWCCLQTNRFVVWMLHNSREASLIFWATREQFCLFFLWRFLAKQCWTKPSVALTGLLVPYEYN